MSVGKRKQALCSIAQCHVKWRSTLVYRQNPSKHKSQAHLGSADVGAIRESGGGDAVAEACSRRQRGAVGVVGGVIDAGVVGRICDVESLQGQRQLVALVER